MESTLDIQVRAVEAQERIAAALEQLAGRVGQEQAPAGPAPLRVASSSLAVLPSAHGKGEGALPVTPVSIARAAKLLGVSKTRTLIPAANANVVRTIRQGKRRLVPPDELRRLAVEGINPPRKRLARRSGNRSAFPPTDLAAELARVAALRQR